MTEALSRLENVDYLVLVAQLDRASPNNEEPNCWWPILNQNVGAGGKGPYRDRRGEAQQFIPAELIEGGKRGEKAGDFFRGDYGRRIPYSSNGGSGARPDHDT